MVAGGCRCCGWVVWLLLGCGVGFGEAMVVGEVAGGVTGGVGWCCEVAGGAARWLVVWQGGWWCWVVRRGPERGSAGGFWVWFVVVCGSGWWYVAVAGGVVVVMVSTNPN